MICSYRLRIVRWVPLLFDSVGGSLGACSLRHPESACRSGRLSDVSPGPRDTGSVGERAAERGCAGLVWKDQGELPLFISGPRVGSRTSLKGQQPYPYPELIDHVSPIGWARESSSVDTLSRRGSPGPLSTYLRKALPYCHRAPQCGRQPPVPH